MPDKIRWGILATGGIARVFADDLLTLPDARITAVGSRSLEAARNFAERYEAPHAHGSWQELAENPDVDVIYVATPHSAHHDAAAICLDAGKAVLCEKPLTLDGDQAADLITRARHNGLFLMEAMWTRFVPAIRRLVDEIKGGAIGRPLLVHGDFGVAFDVGPEHRVRNPALGGGALLDLGVYPIALSQLVLGSPDSITATATLTPEGVDETTAVALRHPGGEIASLTCSIAADSPWTASVSGTEGRIELARGYTAPRGFALHRGDELIERFEIPFLAKGMVHEAIEVHRCLREGLLESPYAPLDDTLAVMRTMDEVRAQIGVIYPS